MVENDNFLQMIVVLHLCVGYLIDIIHNFENKNVRIIFPKPALCK